MKTDNSQLIDNLTKRVIEAYSSRSKIQESKKLYCLVLSI